MTYILLLASVFAWMLIGCSDDVEQEGRRMLKLVPYVSSFSDNNGPDDARTRATGIPLGYSEFTTAYPDPADDYGSINIYLAHKDNASQWVCSPEGNGKFIFNKTNSKWQSSVCIDNSTQYYVYGYMPAGSASCTISSSDYTKGATLTLTGLKVLNPVDVCAIVGVKKTSEAGELTPGQYGYLTDDSGEDNELDLLLQHIYSKVDFRFAVDEEYNKLRTIKLRKVAMELPTGTTSTMTATVNLFNSSAQPMTCTYAYGGGDAVSAVTLLNTEKATEKELSTDYLSVAGYLLPGSDDLSIYLVSTYDVYDKSGNLVRQNCQAKNKISITAAKAGKNYIINMLIKPTYLYQLSEPDLDNPTIVLQTS